MANSKGKKIEATLGTKISEIKELAKNAKKLGFTEKEIGFLLRSLTGRNANI